MAAASLVLVSGCGGGSGNGTEQVASFSSVFAAVKGLQGTMREQKLLNLARQEGGRLTLYTSLSSSNLEKVVQAFERTYGIHVSTYRSHSSDVLARLVEEEKAGRHADDLVAVNARYLPDLQRQGLLVDDPTPARAALSPGAAADGWTAYVSEPYVVAWNTKRVGPAERPRAWESLAAPRWRGRLAIDDNDFDWYQTLHAYWVSHGKTAAQADRLFTAIAKNAVFVHGQSLLTQLLGTGEFDVAVSVAGLVDTLRDQGAPLAWRPPVEPVFPVELGIGLARGSMHPAAAALYVDWLLSPPAQRLLARLHYTPTRAGFGLPATISMQRVTVDAPAAEEKAWSNRFDRLTRLGKALSGS